MPETPAGLPVDSFKEAAQLLRRPFTPAAVKFKVQATWPKDNPTAGLIVGHIDARLVIERLNLVIPHKWHDAYEPTPKGLMWCHLTVDGITRSDVGEGEGKALVSDALKRAAVHFGIGVSLYAIPKMILDTGNGAVKQKRGANGKTTLEITATGEQILRGQYEAWLNTHGIQSYGEPLNHGDVDDAVGDAEAETPVIPAESPAPALEVVSGDVVQKITGENAEKLLDAVIKRKVTPDQLGRFLKGAGLTSVPEDLKDVKNQLAALQSLDTVQATNFSTALRTLPVAA